MCPALASHAEYRHQLDFHGAASEQEAAGSGQGESVGLRTVYTVVYTTTTKPYYTNLPFDNQPCHCVACLLPLNCAGDVDALQMVDCISHGHTWRPAHMFHSFFIHFHWRSSSDYIQPVPARVWLSTTARRSINLPRLDLYFHFPPVNFAQHARGAVSTLLLLMS